MSKAFPEDPFLRGNFAPVQIEGDGHNLPIVGEIPADLNGSLYRNGPNPQFSPRDSYHWFTGDGMVHAFHIEDGKADYRNRWVQTPRWKLEHAAGENLFGAFGNPLTSDPSVVGKDGGVANTNIFWHGNRLLALEEGHAPTEIDPVTLETKGYYDFQGNPVERVTAHPKIDPETGEMVFFAYMVGGWFSKTVGYYVADASGKLTRRDEFEAPYSSMIHDFMVTRNYALFPILPLSGSMERAMAGQAAFAWEPNLGGHIGVLKRDAAIEEMRWFEVDPCYVFHPMNAFEDGNMIHADVLKYDVAPLFPNADGSPTDPHKTHARLVRWTINLTGDSNRIKETQLDDLSGEFPRFDERFAGLGYRHGWYAYSDNDEFRGSFAGIACFDFETKKRETYLMPSSDAIGEPVFVPRTADAPEGDGWLLAVAYRPSDGRSDLLIFNAMNIGDGPIAEVQLSSRVPFGFHGNWRQL
jgi:carotenoid cleavage dioxygenase